MDHSFVQLHLSRYIETNIKCNCWESVSSESIGLVPREEDKSDDQWSPHTLSNSELSSPVKLSVNRKYWQKVSYNVHWKKKSIVRNWDINGQSREERIIIEIVPRRDDQEELTTRASYKSNDWLHDLSLTWVAKLVFLTHQTFLFKIYEKKESRIKFPFIS